VYRPAQLGGLAGRARGRQHAVTREALEERPLVSLPFVARAHRRLVILDQSDLRPKLDVAAVPEAGKRRHVVRVGRRQRERVVLRRLLEAAAPVALEIQHLRREQTPFVQRLGHLFGNRPQILADDERAVARTLEGKDA